MASRFYLQGLANLNIVVHAQIIPSTQIVLGNLITFGDIEHRIAAHHSVGGGIDVYRSIGGHIALSTPAAVAGGV